MTKGLGRHSNNNAVAEAALKRIRTDVIARFCHDPVDPNLHIEEVAATVGVHCASRYGTPCGLKNPRLDRLVIASLQLLGSISGASIKAEKFLRAQLREDFPYRASMLSEGWSNEILAAWCGRNDSNPPVLAAFYPAGVFYDSKEGA